MIDTQETELHFHQQDQLSIYTVSTAMGDIRDFVGEIGTLNFYALRMLNNLGRKPESYALAECLLATEQMISITNAGLPLDDLKLVPYAGHRGRHSFFLSYSWGHSYAPKFKFKGKGFGWLWKGIGYYGPMSVLGFIRHLALKHRGSTAHLEAIAHSMNFCATVHRSGKLNAVSYYNLAVAAAEIGMETGLDSRMVA